MRRSFPKVFLLLLSAAASVAAQTPSAADRSPEDPLRPRSTEITDREPGGAMLPYELTRSAERLVRVTETDKARFAAERRAGFKVLKVFSAPRCASTRLVVDVSSAECTAAIDFIRASFYSLRYGLYGESLMDVRVLEDTLMAGDGGFVHGFILDLGKTDASMVSAKDPQVIAFADFPIARTMEEETVQRRSLRDGIPFGESRLVSTVKLEEGAVYLVRIVSYSFKRDDRFPFGRVLNRPVLYRDQVYLFKFGGVNGEHVGAFLWKKLSDRSAPRL